MGDSDLEEIRRLTVDYAYYFDTRDVDRLAALFTEDAVFDQSPTGVPVISTGNAEIKNMFSRVVADFDKSIHFATNQRVTDMNENVARGTCYFIAWTLIKSGHRHEYIGHYEDEYRKDAGRWLIKSRTLVPHFPVENEGLVLREDA